MSLREGGVSVGVHASLNLGAACRDEPLAVTANRKRLQEALGVQPRYLRQVHGTRVVSLGAEPEAEPPEADASFTTIPGVACTVLAADCLPVLMAASGRRGVAAAHAGWRGLSAGVLEAALAALCEAAGCSPGEVRAWLGACIGPLDFQVGEDVLQAFGADPDALAHPRFMPDGTGRWLADLPNLARDRLEAAGVRQIDGGSWSTFSDSARFFSYRRDRVTGRMAACIWIEP